jgi:hypothetical protein
MVFPPLSGPTTAIRGIETASPTLPLEASRVLLEKFHDELGLAPGANFQLERVGTNDLGVTALNDTTGTSGGTSPVPIPSTAWLLVSGVGGLGVLARKKRAA